MTNLQTAVEAIQGRPASLLSILNDYLTLTKPPIVVLLLVTAALYSRTLAMTGLANAIEGVFLDSGMEPWMIITVMVLIWFALGMIIDSISIMLITAAIFAPIAVKLGYDPIAFAIIGIIAIEAGLLTPPFGLLLFVMRGVAPAEIRMPQIYASVMPFLLIKIFVLALVVWLPGIGTWLPGLMGR